MSELYCEANAMRSVIYLFLRLESERTVGMTLELSPSGKVSTCMKRLSASDAP